MITETWFRGGKKLNGELADIREASGIAMTCRNRPAKARRGAAGGGVAVAFNSGRCNLKRKMLKTRFEIVCVVGKIGKIDKQFAIYCIYVPPNTKAADFSELCEDLATSLGDVRAALKDPVVIIGGDFNNRDPSAAFEAFADIQQVVSGPTRGGAKLDLLFTNASEKILGGKAGTFPPLESENGLLSDHLTVWAGMKFQKKRDFQWLKTTVRLRSEQREEAFKAGLSLLDWGCLDPLDLDQAVLKFEETLAHLTNSHFPFTTFRRRSNEKPWITNAMRRKSKRKKRLYRKRGRSARWRALTKELEDDVRRSKEEFVDGIIESGSVMR